MTRITRSALLDAAYDHGHDDIDMTMADLDAAAAARRAACSVDPLAQAFIDLDLDPTGLVYSAEHLGDYTGPDGHLLDDDFGDSYDPFGIDQDADHLI